MSNITQEMWDELNAKYERVRQNEEMYRVAMSLTNHTISVVDIPNRTLNQIYNEGEWTGIAASMTDAPESIIATGIVHPDDCDGYRRFYDDIYAGVPKGEYSMRTKEENRGWVWYTMYFQTVFDDKGNPLRAICFSDDITIRKRAETQFLQYKSVVSAGADYVWEINLTENRIISSSDVLDFLLGDKEVISYDDLFNKAVEQIVDTEQRDVAMHTFSRAALIDAFKNAEYSISMDYQYQYDGKMGVRWSHCAAHLRDDDKGDLSLILCVSDVTDRYRELERLEMKAEHDQLTQLYNRTSMISRATRIIKEFPDVRHGFIIFDIDDFKSCNDKHGHAFGDDILCMVADVMRRTFRATDILCRLGGDEFVVFMQNASTPEIVLSRAKSLQDAIRIECIKRDLPIGVTISIGATLSNPKETVQQIYLRMDDALYQSKNSGKDKVTIV